MAAYREHITFSTLLGAGYGLSAALLLGFTPTQGALAGWLTAMGGMLPDLDSDSGRPVREMFGLVGALLPLILVQHVVRLLGIEPQIEAIMLLIVVMYLIIKYGGQKLVNAVSVHRGMFHSLPAMVIVGEIIYLSYPSQQTRVKLLMAGGISAGFFSHLLLDEIYSVQWSGVRLKIKKSAGSAVKMFGKPFLPNVVTYSILATLTYITLLDAGLIQPSSTPSLRAERSAPGDVPAMDLGEPHTVDLGAAAPMPGALPVPEAAPTQPPSTASGTDRLILPR